MKLVSFVAGLSLVVAPFFVYAEEEKPLSDYLKDTEKTIKEKQEKAKDKLSKAKKIDDKDVITIWENVEQVLEAKSACFKEGEEIDIEICLDKAVLKLAEEGNFQAQDEIAIKYQSTEHATALKWYNAILNNPKAPKVYKLVILEAIEELEKEIEKSGEKSENTKNIQADKAKHEELMKEYPKKLRKAELLENKTLVELLNGIIKLHEKQTACYEKKEPLQHRVCILESYKTCADSGNFYCQHLLGNIYENSFDNKALAIQWYEKAIKNPKTPKDYIPELESDLKRVQEKKDKPIEKEETPVKKNDTASKDEPKKE
jgi:hypothetical protein